jgi:penicillin-binding protein 1B
MKSSKQKSRGRASGSSRKPRSFFGSIFRFFLYLTPFVLAVVVAYVGSQDQWVREQFEGKRWELPARVFAGAPEIFVGSAYDAESFEWLLGQLKYRRDPQLSTQGTYIRIGDEIIFKTRDFQFLDKPEPAREMRVQFTDGQVILLEEMNTGKSVALLRMEPVQIGSFYPARQEDRALIKIDQAPDLLLKALFASEDRHFYRHHGVSLRGILRAIWVNVRAGGIVQGGSTITQQLVKNFYLTSERTWWRKLNEITMAIILDARYAKNEILEAYLNEIYLGQDSARAIHGFGLASQYYFGRSIEELQLHHIALLVALVRGPSYYDPYKFPDRVLNRRNLILDEMAGQGYIEPEVAAEAQSHPLDVVKNPHQIASRYPAFMDLVRRQLQKEYRPEDLTSEGLRIFTTLDVHIQRHLQQAMTSTLAALEKPRKAHRGLESAAILTRRATGEIAALSGSRDPESSGFNRALDASRQIGSLFKPVVYLTALEESDRYTVTTPLQDTPITIKLSGADWAPKNYDNRSHGTVPLHKALAHSYNLATVRLGMDIGVTHAARTLRRLGVERKVDLVPALLLGAATLTPLEVTQMYQTLASDGFLTPLRAIQAVMSPEGKTLQRFGLEVRQSVDASSVYVLNTVLKEVMRRGTGKPAYEILPASLDVAGKTGTTNDLRDSWFAGFTGDYLGVVWVGKDDNQPAGLSGAEGALKVWAGAMKKVSRESLELEKPDNVELIWVDGARGGRTREGCPTAIQMPFIEGSAPAHSSGCSGKAEIEDDGKDKHGVTELF